MIDRLEPHLNAGQFAFGLDMTPEEFSMMKDFFLLTAKPTLFACNVAEDELGNPDSNPWVAKVRDYVAHHHGTLPSSFPRRSSRNCHAAGGRKAEYLAGLGVKQSGTSTLSKEAYHLLGLRTYLTTGEKETRAWTIQAGDKAPVPRA